MTQSEQGDEPQHPAVRPAHEGAGLPPAQQYPQQAQQQSYAPQQYDPQQYQQQWPAAPGGIPGAAPGQGAVGATPPHGQGWDQTWGADAQGTQHPQGYPEAQQPPVPQQMTDWQPMPPPHVQPPVPQQPAWDMPAPGGDPDATQLIPPVPRGPGALPPENPVPYPSGPGGHAAPAGQSAYGTTGHGSHAGPAQGAGHAGPLDGTPFLGQQALQPPAGSDADATQYLPPVPADAAYAPRPEVPLRPGAPGERQPPAEFDSLFRPSAPRAAEEPDAPASTQQMPRFLPPRQQEAEQEEARYQQYQQPGHGQGGYGPGGGPASGRRKVGAVPMIAAVVIGCSVLGLGISALASSGGETDAKGGDATTVASGSSLPAPPADNAADPAKAQAQELEKLLESSNDSRSTVINAVDSISRCDKLDKAASDLRGAATQRRGLVSRLEALTVDKLPEHAALTEALNRAWQASAAADDHYAAWADRVAGGPQRFCPNGKAQATGARQLGDRESGKASRAKKEAVVLWNSIAGKYGLTRHQATDL
ncbi:hypothetical protein [Streptomyces candidus]|uniref:Uncharacterized protein n=1 Tax=Streptomyces candidus TaxID=67283 RepID=A0A7X0HDJ8_9ACTN|nr:hypothetical protein [Streptomyces candidus]MBB6435551.1 hypothetical protein [Streptomyces candidus]GHH47034.1 hypothetical protein GCM10018773_38970 [Streptomyces candidus]